MPLINTTEVVDRHNRPAVNSRVMLRTFFINDGEFTDPYQISSVHVFQRSQNLSPSTVLNTNGLVASASFVDAAMVFGVSGNGVVGSDLSLAETAYSGTAGISTILPAPPGHVNQVQSCSALSGIYRLGKGEFACVLDGLIGSSLSGVDDNGTVLMNTATAARRYTDIWTVKLVEGSDFKTFINYFETFDDSFISITEPLLLRTKNSLYNRQVILGSKTDLKIGTEITVENEYIDESVKNIFKDSVVTSATVVIKKLNEDSSLPSRVITVSSTDVNITSDNTIIYTLDTDTALVSGDGVTLNQDDLGSRRGTYAIQVTYSVLAEKIVSPMMYFVIK